MKQKSFCEFRRSSMRKSKPIKPRACAIYYPSKIVTKIFYACPNCRFITDKDSILYCYKCGQRWDRRVLNRINGDTTVLREACKKDWSFDSKVLKLINNKMNRHILSADVTKSYEMDMRDFIKCLKEAGLL